MGHQIYYQILYLLISASDIWSDREGGHMWQCPYKKGSAVKKKLSFNVKNINEVEN